MTNFDTNLTIEEMIPEGCGELVSDCCYCYLPEEYRGGDIVICPDCLDHCEAITL